MKNNKLIKASNVLIFLLLMALFLVGCKNSRSHIGGLEQGFKKPSIENRALALWPWLNGYVDTNKLVFELQEMEEKGMRGAIIWDIGALADPDKIIPNGPAFLGEESLEYMDLALKTANELGLDLGMVASSSWNAGGAWVDSADASLQLLLTSQLVEGPTKQRIIIDKPLDRNGNIKRSTLLNAIAVPYSAEKLIAPTSSKSIPLDEFLVEDQLIEWEVPDGKWEVISFFMSNTGQNLVVPSPNSNGLVIDHLSHQATKAHFDSLLGKLKNISSPEQQMKFFMLDSYEVWPMKDWSPQLIEEFKASYGYDPLPYLPLLLGYNSADTVLDERFRHDYSRLVSEMMIKNHFGQSVEIADRYGIEMLTEAGHGGYPRVDPLKALGHSHIPMGEFWNRRWFWVTKEAASAAHLYGKKLVAAESLTGWNHWQHGPIDFKQLIDIAFCQGLNQVVFHTFTHNPASAGKPGFVYHAGEHINVNTTWWEMARPFMDYIARCSFLLRQGNFVGDACLYYGDQAPNLVAPERIDPNIVPRYGAYHQCMHCGKPKPVYAGDMEGYDFDYMNADIIINALRVEENRLMLASGQSYRVMLLPDKPAISLEVLRRLEQLVSEGAIIIGRKPERSNSLKNYPDCDREVKAIANKLWGEIDGQSIFSNNYGLGSVYWGKTTKEVLKELDVQPDFEVRGVDKQDKHIDYIHRQTASEEIYFVSNSAQKTEKVNCTFRVDPNWIPELWDAETGMIQREVTYSKNENSINIDLVLDPLSSRFVIFRKKSKRKKDVDLIKDLQFGFSENEKMANLDLSQGWTLSFDPAMGGPANHKIDKLESWADHKVEGIKYYSGKATYSKAFNIEEQLLSNSNSVFLALEDVQEIAQIKVNDKEVGVIWTPPYTINIAPFLKTGNNSMSIEVCNTWNNRIVGDLNNPDEKDFTQTNAKSKFKANGPLLPSGIIGEVELHFVN